MGNYLTKSEIGFIKSFLQLLNDPKAVVSVEDAVMFDTNGDHLGTIKYIGGEYVFEMAGED